MSRAGQNTVNTQPHLRKDVGVSQPGRVKPANLIYSVDEVPPLPLTITLGLQPVFVMPWPWVASKNTFSPRYGFFDIRFRGTDVDHGLRHGATPCSNCLRILSVMISGTVGICLASDPSLKNSNRVKA